MTTTASPIQRGKEYCRRSWIAYGIGITALFLGVMFDQLLAGLVIYTAASLAGMAVSYYAHRNDSVKVTDEREEQLALRASHFTFWLYGYLGLFSFIALALLDATGTYEFPAVAEPLLYAYSAVVLTWGGVFTLLKRRK